MDTTGLMTNTQVGPGTQTGGKAGAGATDVQAPPVNPPPVNVGLPNGPVSPQGKTGVASSNLADETLNTQAQGTAQLQGSVNAHTQNKQNGAVLGYRPDISIVDLLNSKGMPSDYDTRAQMALKAGIKDYMGTAEQNTQLIGIVNGGTGNSEGGANGNKQNTQAGNTANTSANGTTQGTGSPGDVYTPQIDAVTKDQATALQSWNDQVTQIMNGTFPLTAYQQTILNKTQTQFDEIAKQQAIANKSYENGVAIANNRLGLNKENPQQYFAKQQQAISNGLEKINNLDATAAKTIAELHQSFLDKDYTMINDHYNTLQKALENKGKAIQDLQTRSDKLFTETRDYNEKVNEFKQNQKLEYAKLYQPSYSISQNGDGTQTILNTKTGQTVHVGQAEADAAAKATPGNTGVAILDGNTKTTYKNVPYVDGSSLTGKVAEDAERKAAIYGIPYFSANESGAIDKMQSARSNLYDINNSITGLLPKDASGRTLGGALNNKLSAYLQTDAEKASFNTWRSAAIGVLQSLAGGAGSGLRINQQEIALSVANDIPNITDTAATAQAKMAKVNAMIDNQEHSMMGTQYYDKFNPDYAVRDLGIFASSSPEHLLQVQKIHAQNPNLTPYQVLQIAQP